MPSIKTPLPVLREIQRRDPDGDEGRTTAPTIDELNAFESWIADTYGLQAVTDYYGIWEPRSFE